VLKLGREDAGCREGDLTLRLSNPRSFCVDVETLEEEAETVSD